MTTPPESLDQRARDALRIVENDPRARVRFAAAYTGHGDAVAALRLAADASRDASDDQRQRDLRKVAFGRTHGPAEEEAAAQARRTLLEAEQARAAMASVLDAAIRALKAKPEARAAEHPMEQSAMPSAPPPPPPSRMRLLWVLPVAVICLAVAYAAGSATRGESDPSSSPPTPSPTAAETAAPTETPAVPRPPGFSGLDATLIATPGDPVAAEKWFDRPQQAQDTFDVIPMLAHLNIEPPDVRFVQTDLDGYSVWVAKSTSGEFCLLGSYGGMGYSTCAPRDQFAMSSLLLIQDHNAIRWDGVTVTVSTSPDN